MAGELFAGVPGGGAGVAVWLFGRTLETARLENSHACAMATDIYKCFDQVIRELVLSVACYMGCPMGLLRAWFTHLEHMTCYNALAAAVGQPYRRACAIPQGCPLSMMWVAMLSLPFVAMSKASQAIPRCLADDWMLVAIGPGAVEIL
eukprot:3084560-Alexandrium_andersonii.AAC.1